MQTVSCYTATSELNTNVFIRFIVFWQLLAVFVQYFTGATICLSTPPSRANFTTTAWQCVAFHRVSSAQQPTPQRRTSRDSRSVTQSPVEAAATAARRCSPIMIIYWGASDHRDGDSSRVPGARTRFLSCGVLAQRDINLLSRWQ